MFIRLWLVGVTKSSKVGRNWTISQMAVLFEVTQASLFRDEPHTVTSLSREMELPAQTVSRIIRDLAGSGLVKQEQASTDARKKYLSPMHDFFAKDALLSIVERFAKQWYAGDSWQSLDKSLGADWYFPMSQCTDTTASKKMKNLEDVSKDFGKAD